MPLTAAQRKAIKVRRDIAARSAAAAVGGNSTTPESHASPRRARTASTRARQGSDGASRHARSPDAISRASGTIPLHPAQQRVWDDPSRFLIVAAGRRWGKTVFGVEFAIDALKWAHPDGRDMRHHDTWYVAPTLEHAETLAWRRFETRLAERDLIDDAKPHRLYFIAKDGSRLALRSFDNPQRLRGSGLRRMVIDEYADADPGLWQYVLRPSLMDLAPHSRCLFIGSIDKLKSHFHRLHKRAAERAGWSAYTFTSQDNPFLSRAEFDDLVEDMDADAYQAEILSQWGDARDPLPSEQLGRQPRDADRAGARMVAAAYLRTFDERRKVSRYEPLHLEQSAVMVAELLPGDRLNVREVQRGKWTARELVTRMLAVERSYKPISFAISEEHLDLIRSTLEAQEDRTGLLLQAAPLSVPREPVDWATYALQHPLERGKISANDEARQAIADQMELWPDSRVRDAIVCLAMCSEEAHAWRGAAADDEQDRREPIDLVVGF